MPIGNLTLDEIFVHENNFQTKHNLTWAVTLMQSQPVFSMIAAFDLFVRCSIFFSVSQILHVHPVGLYVHPSGL